MIDLNADCIRRGDVTCVRVTVSNGQQTPQVVELESTIDGDVWAPDSAPLSVSEWTDSTWVGVVRPGRTRGLGFATSGDPVDEPVEIASIDRAQPTETRPNRVLDGLEDAAPPSSIIDSKP